MPQTLDPHTWPSIEFQGEPLPQSLIGISILIHQDFTEATGDWIWRFSNCKNAWKKGEPAWCVASAVEISDYLLDHRDEVIPDIERRLGPYGLNGQATYEEWLTGLARIRTLAASSDGDCRWIAGEPATLKPLPSFLR